MILEPKGRGWRLVAEDVPWEWDAREHPSMTAQNDKRWTILRKKVQANARIGR